MAKRTARDFAANMEQQTKQFKPVRGEQRQLSLSSLTTVVVQTSVKAGAAHALLLQYELPAPRYMPLYTHTQLCPSAACIAHAGQF
jgi:hypothetical protein